MIFYDLIVDPSRVPPVSTATVPTEVGAVDPGTPSGALIGCVIVIILVTAVMLLVRHSVKKKKASDAAN